MDKGVKDLIEELREYAAPRKGELAGILLEAANRLEELTVKEPAKSDLLHVTYHLYNAQNKTNGFGAAEVRVSSHIITLDVINKIRDQLLQDFPEGSTIVILSWQRYDAEEVKDAINIK